MNRGTGWVERSFGVRAVAWLAGPGGAVACAPLHGGPARATFVCVNGQIPKSAIQLKYFPQELV